MTAVPPNDNQRNSEQIKIVSHYRKKPGHVIGDCRKWIKKVQEQQNDPSNQNTKTSTSRSFASCTHCHRTDHPAEDCWSDPNAPNRPKILKQDHPADNRINGEEQQNLTHLGLISILRNSLT